MVLIIIFLFVNISMWAGLAFAYSSSCIHNEPYVLGIQIPREQKNSAQVQEILAQYKSKYRKITVAGFLLGILMLLANEYMSIIIMAIVLWFGALMWFYENNVMEKARMLYELKLKNGWLVGEPHVVRIDTALSSMRDKKSVSMAWWIPSGIAAVFAGFLGWQNMQPYSLVFIISYGSAFIAMFLVYISIRYARPHVYCDKSEINQKINSTVKFEWTKCFVLQGYFLAFMSIYFAFPDILVKRGIDQGINATAIIMTCFFLTAGTLFVMLLSYFNVKKVKNTLLSCLADKGEEIYGDDDEYWLNGYNSSGRKHTGLTEKRIGVGFTFQSASGFTEKCIIIVTILVTMGLALFIMPFDFADISLEIEGESCRIQAASMGISFDISDVEQVTLLDEMPSMSKKHGYDSNRLLLGDFRVEGFGKCKAYVSLHNESVIKIDTNDGIIWLNHDSELQTQQFYSQLTDVLKQQKNEGK